MCLVSPLHSTYLRHSEVSRGGPTEEVSRNRNRSVKAAARPAAASVSLATPFSLALPPSRGWYRPPPPAPFPLSVSVALARARQSSPEDSANRSRDDDLMLRSRILPPSNSSTLPRSFHNFDLVGEKDFLIEYRPFSRRRDFFRSVNTSELSSCFSSTLLCLRRRHARHLGDSRGVALNLLTEKRCGAYDTLIEK